MASLWDQAKAFADLYTTTGVDIGPFKKVHAGSWYGLPDVGATEFVGKVFGSGSPQPYQRPWSAHSSSGASGSWASPEYKVGGSPPAPGPGAGVPDSPSPQPKPESTEVDKARKTLSDMDAGKITWDDNLRAWANNILSGGSDSGVDEGKIRADIEASYAPVFEELDRRIGLLPGQKAGWDKLVSDLADYQREEAQTSRRGMEMALEREEGGEKARSSQTLREMAGDVSNLMRAAGNIWGGSSAVPAVMSGIGKRASQMRGQIVQARDQALREIADKKTQLESTYNQQLDKITNWVNEQTLKIKDEFDTRLQEIENQKIGASTDKANALTNLSLQIFRDAQQRLAQADQMANQFKYSMDVWRQQREGDLQDYIAKLQAHAKYSPSSYGYQMPDVGGNASIQNQTPATYYGESSQPTYRDEEDEKIWKNNIFYQA